MIFKTNGLNVLCIVSKPTKESLNISPDGCEYVAKTDERIKISIPPGAVENDETVCIHVCKIVFFKGGLFLKNTMNSCFLYSIEMCIPQTTSHKETKVKNASTLTRCKIGK